MKCIFGLFIQYASEVWDNCPSLMYDKLEMLQLEAARIVTGLPEFASRYSLYNELEGYH